MQSNYQNSINIALKELRDKKDISTALGVCNTLLEYMGVETKSIEDIELSKLKLPNAERYDRWFEAHPHFRGDRACFDLTPKATSLEAKFFALQKRSKLFIAGSVSFTPNFEDRDYTRNDPNMKVGIDFFLTPEQDSMIVVLSNKGSLRLVELSGRLTNTQNDIFTLWHNVAQSEDRNILHATIWESFKLSSLNKKFYAGISDSFTSLTQHLQSSGVEEQLANQFANRLHGRLLFLWFLRKKSIINESKEYFTLGDQDDTAYYANTLSALFFNVLNNEDHKDFDSVTPYLNGGLFDKESDGEYWNKNRPSFPRGFFRALYDHFDSFNFTTDESTPEYEQIAIDPEMLGRIFESFLATLTTETGAQAKKANGAFYTPREIVSYMSRESLRQYLYTALDAGATLKTSIDDLLDRPDSEWALAGTNSKRDAVSKEDRERILEALRKVKVLDPAVGSGAFPMGVLHKILSVFERLEPNFDSYETKLSILRNNIYGVDIDPTAIDISRLRAWLSIIVDVKDVKKIKPLPNLDFKFVCANSLMGLEKGPQDSLTTDRNLKSELICIRDEYYATSNKKNKEKLQKKYIELTHSHQNSLLDTEETRQLKSYRPFENGRSASFYDSELMHGVEAFDVVIGNPPYVQVGKNIYSDLQFPYSEGKDKGKQNLYKVFIENGYNLLKNRGVCSLIVQSSLMCDISATFTRELLLSKARVRSVIEFPQRSVNRSGQVFESVLQGTCIVIFEKVNPESSHAFGISINNDTSTIGDLVFQSISQAEILSLYPVGFFIPLLSNGDLEIIRHMRSESTAFTNAIQSISQGDVNLTTQSNFFSLSNKGSKLIRGRHISCYSVNKKVEEFFDSKYKESVVEFNRTNYSLLIQQVVGADSREKRLICARTMLGESFLIGNSLNKITLKPEFKSSYILGLLNSKSLDWFFRKTSTNNHVNGYEIEQLPLPKLDTQEKIMLSTQIESLVDEILSGKEIDQKTDSKAIEIQIDILVYKLFGLSEEEVKIIEAKK